MADNPSKLGQRTGLRHEHSVTLLHNREFHSSTSSSSNNNSSSNSNSRPVKARRAHSPGCLFKLTSVLAAIGALILALLAAVVPVAAEGPTALWVSLLAIMLLLMVLFVVVFICGVPQSAALKYSCRGFLASSRSSSGRLKCVT